MVSGNLVGGATFAIGIAGTATVTGNFVGASVDGTVPLPVGVGIYMISASAAVTGNRISNSETGILLTSTRAHAQIEQNTISQSARAVVVADTSSASIRKNSMTGIASIGIDLLPDGPTPNDAGDADTGPNSLQNYPTLTGKVLGGSTTVTGTLSSSPNATFVLDFYANAAGTSYGEAQRYIGSTTVTTNGAGTVAFTATGLSATTASEEITATATNVAEQTSEISISPPVAVADTATTNEDTSVNVPVLANDTDVDSPNADLRVGSVTNVIGGTAQISGDGRSVDFVPAANANGTTGFSFTYTTVDATGAVSAPATATITVAAVDDATNTALISSANPSAFGQGVTFTATVTSGAGTPTGAVQFKVDGTNLGTPVTLAGGTATSPSTSSLGVGTHTVTADYSGVAFLPSSGALIQMVGKVSQAITFTSTPVNPVVGGTYNVTATGGGSGNPVTFTSATAGTCSVSGTTVSFLAVGTCTVNANQAGNATYDPAPQMTQTMTVAKGPQAITFTSPAPVNPVVGTAYTVAATGGGSGNPVTFTSATSSTCTVSGVTVSFVGVGTCTVNANQAGNANYDPAPQVTQTITVVKASPTISTQASPGNLVGAPVRDTATLAGGFNPTGTVTFKLFSDADCAAQVFTSTTPLGTPSDWLTPATAGTYRWTAVYNGDANNNTAAGPCNAANESVTLTPFVAPTYTRIVEGDLLGPVTVNAGESVLITPGSRVVGPVTVQPGGALTVENASITRGVVVDNPRFLSICGTSISGPSPEVALAVSNAAVPIRIGDPATGCAGNRFAGQVTLTANLAVTFGANQVSHAATVDNGGPGQAVIKANTFFASLACTGNTPAPTNAGQPNTAASKTGQCTAV